MRQRDNAHCQVRLAARETGKECSKLPIPKPMTAAIAPERMPTASRIAKKGTPAILETDLSRHEPLLTDAFT